MLYVYSKKLQCQPLYPKHSKLLWQEDLVYQHLKTLVFILAFHYRSEDAIVGIGENSKSQAKEDKGKFFHID